MKKKLLFNLTIVLATLNNAEACKFNGGQFAIQASAYQTSANLIQQEPQQMTYRISTGIGCSARFNQQSGMQVKLLAEFYNTEQDFWLNPKELYAYFDFETLPLTFNIGYQQKPMGYFEAEQINALFNPKNYQDGLFNNSTIGRFALSLSYQTEFWSLQADVMPLKQFDKWSQQGGRFRRGNFIVTDRQFDEQSNDLSWQLKSDYVNEQLELSIHYWHGLLPQAEVIIGPQGPLHAIDYYHHIQQLGLSWQYMFGDFSLKSDSYIRAINDKEIYSFSFGLNSYHYNIFNSYADATFFIESYYISADLNDPELTSSFDNDIYLGTRINLNNGKNANVEFGLIHDYKTTSLSLYTEYSQSVNDVWQLTFGLELYQPDSQDIKQISFNNDSRIYLNNEWYF